MNDFPIIETIDDVLPFIRERKEFIVAERQWGIAVDYQVSMPDSFITPQARECRGIKFRLDGRLLARPYHKFFNFGEAQMRVEDLISAGRFNDKFDILDKMDGSMIHPIIKDDTVLFCTRMGTTDVAEQALKFAKSHINDTERVEPWYMDFCYDLSKSELTPIFEWCSRKQRIVLDYPADRLVLTAIRVNKTGEYLTRGKMHALAAPYYIPMVDTFSGNWDGIDSFLSHVHGIEDAEGYVIRWHDGTMGKTKGEWYVQIHRAKDVISHEKRVIGLILEDNIDDVLPFLLAHDFERATAYRKDFWDTIKKKAISYESRVTDCKEYTYQEGMSVGESRKYFATEFMPKFTAEAPAPHKVLYKIWEGKLDAHDLIEEFLRTSFSLGVAGAKTNGNQKMVDDLRGMGILPEKDWLDY
jgi:RNA ligase